MNAQLQVVLIAAGCTGAVGVLGTGVIRLLRQAPLRTSVQVSGTIVVLAVVAGTLGTAEAMFVSPHDLGVVVMVCLVAAVIAAGFGCLLGRQVEAGSRALRQAARSLGDQDDGYRSPAGPLTAELAALSHELAVTGEKLKESRAREHALEQSRRQLVAWVSHDLRAPAVSGSSLRRSASRSRLRCRCCQVEANADRLPRAASSLLCALGKASPDHACCARESGRQPPQLAATGQRKPEGKTGWARPSR